jgi:type VI secretion system ImpJ/VasE family protein
MSIGGLIHWHEGLFLQPHHLQILQRQSLDMLASERRLFVPYPYGVIESRLSTDALENLLVKFDRLRVVMPSGLEVNVPENAEIPALDIKRAFNSSSGGFTVSLGVPMWYPQRGNTVERNSSGGALSTGTEDWRVKRIYRLSEVERADENTGENLQPLMVRKINARLLLPDDDTSDMEVLPLLKIAHATGDELGMPRSDSGFVPPCLLLSGSATLRELVRDLANAVEAARKELVAQVTRLGIGIENMSGKQFEQIMRLRTLNRFSGRLPSLAVAPGVTPFAIYLELRELLGELAGLRPERDQFEAAKYDHDNPGVVFADLSNKIRPLLRGAVTGKYLSVDFTRDGDVFTASLTDEHMTAPNDYFLAIKTNQDPRGVAKLVEDADSFKLMPMSMKDRNVFGVKLDYEQIPPQDLPQRRDVMYFRLGRADSERMWNRVKEEKKLACRWPDMDASDFKELKLFMTVP